MVLFVKHVRVVAKTAISLVTSFRLFASNSAAPTARIPAKFDNGDFYKKPVEKIQIWLYWDKNNGHFTWRSEYFVLLAEANMRR
jgi:hypothetical protein